MPAANFDTEKAKTTSEIKVAYEVLSFIQLDYFKSGETAVACTKTPEEPKQGRRVPTSRFRTRKTEGAQLLLHALYEQTALARKRHGMPTAVS